MSKITNVAFYKFITLSNLTSLKNECEAFCKQEEIRGTLLLAKEGVNAILAGKDASIHNFLHFFTSKLSENNRNHPSETDLKDNILDGKLECKFSYSEFIPFQKLKVLIKKEIITMKVPGLDPEHSTGIRLDPSEWNKLLTEEEVLVIDTRNQYEIALGTFTGSINPNTDQFSDFPAFVKKHLDSDKHKKIAMFCTGGIRCEKASAYLMKEGFKEVYQLHGGILNYLNDNNSDQSLWEGKCFVFDERVTL